MEDRGRSHMRRIGTIWSLGGFVFRIPMAAIRITLRGSRIRISIPHQSEKKVGSGFRGIQVKPRLRIRFKLKKQITLMRIRIAGQQYRRLFLPDRIIYYDKQHLHTDTEGTECILLWTPASIRYLGGNLAAGTVSYLS
jgi:hypothetical protein